MKTPQFMAADVVGSNVEIKRKQVPDSTVSERIHPLPLVERDVLQGVGSLRDIDLMMTDPPMAVMDGLTFVKCLRNDPQGTIPYIPIVMLTSHGDTLLRTA